MHGNRNELFKGGIMFRKTKQIKEFINSIKKTLDLEPPFEEFTTPKPMEEDIFIDYFAPYLRETIEDCFCAKVRCEGKKDIVVEFDTGERLELHLTCKIPEQA